MRYLDATKDQGRRMLAGKGESLNKKGRQQSPQPGLSRPDTSVAVEEDDFMDEDELDLVRTLERYESQRSVGGGGGLVRNLTVEELQTKVITPEKTVLMQSKTMAVEVIKESGKTEVHLHFHNVMEGATNCTINANK